MSLDLSRRRLFQCACCLPVAGVAGGAFAGMPFRAIAADPTAPRTTLNPDEALELLREGNRNFNTDSPIRSVTGRARRLELALSQAPFVILVSCSDSRVPPELLFGRGLGEMFIVRNAGNTVDTTALGSIEYAVAQLGVPLIVVMGHQRCGAVSAAVSVVEQNDAQKRLISNIFEMEDRTVEELMTSRARMVSLLGSASPSEIASLITEQSLSRYPVFGASLDDALGVLHVKDFVRNRLAQGSVDLQSILRPLPRVAGGMSAFDLMTLFKKQRIHAALVVDEFGGTLGFVTMDDLVTDLIDDDDRAISGSIVPQPDGSMLVDGEVTLAELEEDYSLPIEHPDVSTVAGLFLAINGVLPKTGEIITYKGVRLTAEDVRGLKVQSVRISQNQPVRMS